MFSYVVSKLIQSAELNSRPEFGFKPIAQDHWHKLYEYADVETLAPAIHAWLHELGYDKVFEGCHIFSHTDEYERFRAINFLFSNIGGVNYLNNINRPKNISCYNELYSGAIQLLNSRPTDLLDFGSGPGLIADSNAAKTGISIICFDTAECNLDAVRSEGLSTVTLEEFYKLRPASFDLILSAYVLHYQSVTKDELYQAMNLLRRNGVWASNFHKSKGLNWFLEEIMALGTFKLHYRDSSHGPLLFVQKNHDY